MTSLTAYRREVLARLAERGPLMIDEARQDHPNIMPTLTRAGWAQAHWENEIFVGYRITDLGRKAIAP